MFSISLNKIYEKNGIKKIKNANRIQKIQNISNRAIPRFYAKKDEFESNGLITISLKRYEATRLLFHQRTTFSLVDSKIQTQPCALNGTISSDSRTSRLTHPNPRPDLVQTPLGSSTCHVIHCEGRFSHFINNNQLTSKQTQVQK